MAGKQFLVPKRNVLPPGTVRSLYGGHPYEIGKDVSQETADYLVEKKAAAVEAEEATQASENDTRKELETRAQALGLDGSGFSNKGELAKAINEKETEAGAA